MSSWSKASSIGLPFSNSTQGCSRTRLGLAVSLVVQTTRHLQEGVVLLVWTTSL